jgi:L-threonylcarbamoyladenylate synthase
MIIEHPTDRDLLEAAILLKNGGLVAFPTETVYGLGADADNSMAVKDIFDKKGRPTDHPLIVHVPDLGSVDHFALNVPDFAKKLMSTFWPGPLTLVFQKRQGVANAASGHHSTIGLRMPSHPLALELLKRSKELGVLGVAAPSANRFGRVSPTQAAHVSEEFDHDLLILNGGSCQIGIESTIIDCSRGLPVLLRPGQLSTQELEQAIESQIYQQLIDQDPDENTSPKLVLNAPNASGRLLAHYAPKAKVSLLSAQELRQKVDTYCPKTHELIGIWSPKTYRPTSEYYLFEIMPSDAAVCAHELFSTLRNFDKAQVHQIWIEHPPTSPAWQGVYDRLKRASSAQ